MEKNQIVAMAVAAIAEELQTDIKRIRVIEFKEIEKSNLEKFIEKNGIHYQKFQLGD